MKVAIVGCGAIGSFYGAKLARAGHEAHFLLRSDYEVVCRDGVRIFSYQGDFLVRPHCARRPEEIGPSDLVLVGLKTTANDQFPRLLSSLVGPQTAVVTLQNGLGNEEQLARLFPPAQILGGLCFVCLNRTAPGQIHHLDHGQIVLGEFQGPAQARTRRLADQFVQAGVPCALTENLARTHWEKLIWNIPFNGLGVAGVAGWEAFESAKPNGGISHSGSAAARDCATLTTDRLLADPRWSELLRELMMEVIHVARALGFDVPDSLADKNFERTSSMGPYKASTLIDFEKHLPLELGSLFIEPLRQAHEAGVAVPRLERLCEVLGQLDRTTRH